MSELDNSSEGEEGAHKDPCGQAGHHVQAISRFLVSLDLDKHGRQAIVDKFFLQVVCYKLTFPLPVIFFRSAIPTFGEDAPPVEHMQDVSRDEIYATIPISQRRASYQPIEPTTPTPTADQRKIDNKTGS